MFRVADIHDMSVRDLLAFTEVDGFCEIRERGAAFRGYGFVVDLSLRHVESSNKDGSGL